MEDTAESPGPASAQKPAIILTGVSGNLGLRLLPLLPDFRVIGVDVRPPETSGGLAHFERIDLAEERSCNQLLELMGRHRPDAIVHLAFIVDPLRAGVLLSQDATRRDRPRLLGAPALDHKQMWHINVAGTGRVIEAVAEYNRMLGGLHKFIFPSSISVYGPDLPKAVAEDAPMQAHTLPYALHKRETDLTVQARAYSMKCKTYILRPAIFVGPTIQNYLVGVLRGVPGGTGVMAQRLRSRSTRLPLLLPAGGNYLEHKFQFLHVDDIARLIAYILRRRQTDPQLSIMNVAGRGDPIALQTCARMAKVEIKRVPGRALCRLILSLLWKLGISDVPPEALPYLLGTYIMETARLRVFLGEDYKKVIHYTCEEALAATLKQV